MPKFHVNDCQLADSQHDASWCQDSCFLQENRSDKGTFVSQRYAHDLEEEEKLNHINSHRGINQILC